MALEQEITAARKEIVADGYDMSIGELVNLYRDNELQINPAYQRLFRWPATTKTRFIESILLGLPLPPIFVFQQTSGVWELIDGLQRLSTVLEFVGILKNSEGADEAAVEVFVNVGRRRRFETGEHQRPQRVEMTLQRRRVFSMAQGRRHV